MNKSIKPRVLLPPDVVAARGAFDTLERELIFGLSRSYKFYRSMRETICPYDQDKMLHRMDFTTSRYNILYRAIDAFFRRFDNVDNPPMNLAIPPLVLSAYMVDWANRNGIAADIATEIIEEIIAEKELAASFTYESLTALAGSAAFADWLSSRVLEQTVSQISAQKNLGLLTMETLSEAVEKAKTSTAGSLGLAKRISERQYQADIEIPQPMERYKIGGIGVSTPGNLSTVSGQSKTGKTAVTVAMIASTFANAGADCLGFNSSNPDQHAVIYIDTEQSLYDSQQLMKTAGRRAGAPLPNWVQSYCLTGFTPTDIRKAIPWILEQAKKQLGGIHSLIVDGVADVANDVNDQGESNAIVGELHALAIKYDCSIVICIHLNPGKEVKMRGHLGSQCERKAETNLKIEKDGDHASVLWADKNRRSPILKSMGPRFRWDYERGMHSSIESLGVVRKEAARTELQELFSQSILANGSRSYSEMADRIMSLTGRGKSTAERKIKDATDAGLIQKNAAGSYELCKPTLNPQTTLNSPS
jgi:AAA domain